ncbi:D-2-hydroxyacid dehydrogenase [Mesobacillus foraminis]|uniref:D-2-hydroxyacid dehydrogenase n=1 Tax=Mesobacillus foraminis TaxID=279826 RepID=UPI000EF45FB6|nr:D-2-hydroxyacid dehydrogenase [Mesobacillus foraminis]
MNVNHILVAGNFKEEFNKKMPDQLRHEFRFLPVEKITGEDLDWADVYVGFQPAPDFDLSKINWVHSFNAGVNNYLELSGWSENQVLLTRTVCSFGQRISEYCLSYVLRDIQYHQEFHEKQRLKKWEKRTPKMIRDQTVVIYGTGDIGQEVAKTFDFFGATVYGISRSGSQKPYFKKVFDTAPSSILSRADWVISTLPLTPETDKLFNSSFFNQMNGSFINVGRGATVDEKALIKGLDKGNVQSAILDVLAEEPLPVNSSLWTREDVTITPHISAVTELDEAIQCFLETLRKVENEEVLPNLVDVGKGY